jgi:hypothetical protein
MKIEKRDLAAGSGETLSHLLEELLSFPLFAALEGLGGSQAIERLPTPVTVQILVDVAGARVERLDVPHDRHEVAALEEALPREPSDHGLERRNPRGLVPVDRAHHHEHRSWRSRAEPTDDTIAFGSGAPVRLRQATELDRSAGASARARARAEPRCQGGRGRGQAPSISGRGR